MKDTARSRWLLTVATLCLCLTAATGIVRAQETETPAETAPESPGIQEFIDRIDSAFSTVNEKLSSVLFFDIAFGRIEKGVYDERNRPVIDPETGLQQTETQDVPFIIVVLVGGAVFFTIWFRFINIRGFRHSIAIIRGHYDDPNDQGEISHFRALTSALSATVGLGNIAGVAIAIQLGGPGAVFWMMLTAVFAMTSKFSSCTLAQLYRRYNPDGTISGGPMYYLDLGLKEKGGIFRPLGKFLAVFYAFMVMGGALGGGNMFQSNQSFEAVRSTFPQIQQSDSWIFGVILSVLVGLVVVGGIRRIGAVTSRIVPAMCGLYVLASLYIIFTNFEQLPETIRLIFTMAFTENALYGGVAGVVVCGVMRAAFSNEGGLGSAAIAHAAAKTDEPVREGLVAMIGPFIDTIIICFMTASVVIITGAWNDPEIPREAGVTLTTRAFGSEIPWFEYVLAICILLFAYSTMISWAYYGERGWIYLMDHFGGAGLKTVLGFRLVFVLFVFFGAVTQLKNALTFTDLMILSMAYPNIIGSILLAPVVLKKLQDYWRRYKSGEMLPDR